MSKIHFILLCAVLSSLQALAQPATGDTRANTYCNPVNLDYTYMIYNAHKDLSYRSGADPAVVRFRNEYYMFVTRSMGYWHSTNLLDWTFIKPRQWYFEGSNAPAAHNYKDSLLYVAGNPSGAMSILYTDNPKKGDWQAVPSIVGGLQDPNFFIDDNGQAYMFWGSSNKFPIRGRQLHRNKRFRPGDAVELFNLDGEKHGWERFGENHSDTVQRGYIEGPWMTKHQGKYYMQYAAPGTEFDVYADGVYTADNPLGPYTYAPNNPISYKPGGFANGAGHGSTVMGPQNLHWHFATMAVAVNIGWERRISMFPTYFDSDGLMYSNTSFGDYPHYAPDVAGQAGTFTGWMLLSYNKPTKTSSTLNGFEASHLTDEDVKTFWVADKNEKDHWVEIDLQKPSDVYAIQINYNDYQSDMYGKIEGLYHRYLIQGSSDGKTWNTLVDKSNNYKDVPNDYVELVKPEQVRYVRYQHIHVPTPYLSISDIRVFGKGNGKTPSTVKNLKVERHDDRRDATVSWDALSGSQGYNVKWGIAPDKLYSSWLVYGKNKLELKSLNTDQQYYFAVEPFNENGIGKRSNVVTVK